MKNQIREEHQHRHGGVPGENLPFKIGRPMRMTVYFILYFGAGTTAPWLILRYQLLKKNKT